MYQVNSFANVLDINLTLLICSCLSCGFTAGGGEETACETENQSESIDWRVSTGNTTSLVTYIALLG
jgi:hypothetical protein